MNKPQLYLGRITLDQSQQAPHPLKKQDNPHQKTVLFWWAYAFSVLVTGILLRIVTGVGGFFTLMAMPAISITIALPILMLMGLLAVRTFPVTDTPILTQITWEFRGFWLALLMAIWVLPDAGRYDRRLLHPIVAMVTETHAETISYAFSLFFVAVAVILWIMMIIKRRKNTMNSIPPHALQNN